MKALIVGLGGIGCRHARILRELRPDARLCGCRLSPSGTPIDDGNAALFERLERDLDAALAWAPDVAIVATPAATHAPIAARVALAGIHLLIEKPLATSSEDAEALLSAAQRGGAVLMVGYNLRFDPGLRSLREAIADGCVGRVLSVRADVGQFLPDWRPGRDYRQTCSARADLGGGAFFELSHEIDYVRWLVGEPRVLAAQAVTSGALAVDVPDIAEILLAFDNGALGGVHLDMLDRSAHRRCRIVGTEGTVEWNGITGEAALYRAADRRWVTLTGARTEPHRATHLRQMEHFLDCIAGRTTPTVDGRDALRTLEVVLAAERAVPQPEVVAW